MTSSDGISGKGTKTQIYSESNRNTISCGKTEKTGEDHRIQKKAAKRAGIEGILSVMRKKISDRSFASPGTNVSKNVVWIKDKIHQYTQILQTGRKSQETESQKVKEWYFPIQGHLYITHIRFMCIEIMTFWVIIILLEIGEILVNILMP